MTQPGAACPPRAKQRPPSRRHREPQRIHWRHERVRLAERFRAAHQTTLLRPAVAQPQYVRTDGCAIDSTTGEVIVELHVASDGRWIWDETDRGCARLRTAELEVALSQVF